MSSRRGYPGDYEAARSPRSGDAWLPLFVLALATFLGSLLILTDAVIPGAGRRGEASAFVGQRAEGTQPPRDASAGSAAPGIGATDATLGDPPAVAPAWDDMRLRRSIEDALGPDIAHVSVVVRRLADGRAAAVNGDHVYYAASTFKLAILYEAERRRSTGELDVDSVIYMDGEDLTEDLGTLDRVVFEADGGIRVRAALEAMTTYSDNSSAVALLHLLGGSAIDESLRALGLHATSVNTRDLPTTADDLALLMQAIVQGRGVSREARDEMRSFLLNQRTRDGIPAGLPSHVAVGNKTGTWENATHDVAFVDAPNGVYVIVILSDQGWAWEPIRRVSKAVFREMSASR